MTLAQVEQCSEATARTLTDQLRQSLVISWELLVEAYQRRAWSALGYASWDAYTDAELGEVRLRLPREERREVVASMTEAGMSTRAIGSALGVAQDTVRRDQSGERFRAAADEPIDAEIVDEDAELLKQWDSGPGARPTEADAERWLQATVAGRIPKSVLGTDGKSYPAPAKRRPLGDVFTESVAELDRAIKRIERLVADDRFPQNADQVATRHRSDLIRAIDAIHGVANRLPAA